MAEQRHLFVTRIRQASTDEWPGWGGGTGSLAISVADGVWASHGLGRTDTAVPENWRVAVVNGRFLAEGDPTDQGFCQVPQLVCKLASDPTKTWVHIGEHLSASRQAFWDGLSRACTGAAAQSLKGALPYNLGLAGQSPIPMDVQTEVERFQKLVCGSVIGGTIEKGVLDDALRRLDALWNRLRADWRLKALRPLFALSIDMAGLLRTGNQDLSAYLKEIGEVWRQESPSLAGVEAELGAGLAGPLAVQGVLQMVGDQKFDPKVAKDFVTAYGELVGTLEEQARGQGGGA